MPISQAVLDALTPHEAWSNWAFVQDPREFVRVYSGGRTDLTPRQVVELYVDLDLPTCYPDDEFTPDALEALVDKLTAHLASTLGERR